VSGGIFEPAGEVGVESELTHRCAGYDKTQHLNTRVRKGCTGRNSSCGHTGINPIVLNDGQEHVDSGFWEKLEADTWDERLVDEDCYRTVLCILNHEGSR